MDLLKGSLNRCTSCKYGTSDQGCESGNWRDYGASDQGCVLTFVLILQFFKLSLLCADLVKTIFDLEGSC